MSHNLRLISVEPNGNVTEEMQAMEVPPEEQERLLSRMWVHGVCLEGLTGEAVQALRQEANIQGMEICLKSSPEGGGRALLLGDGHRFRVLVERCLSLPALVQIGREIQDGLRNLSRSDYRLKCGPYELELGKRTLMMGVLNVTPDSFSDGGQFLSPQEAILQGSRLIEEGADCLDMGGESSRPGAVAISAEEELRRVLVPLRHLVKMGNIPISVDTYKSEVARIALEEGASLINDISGLHFDPDLARVVARAGAGMVLMHMKGTPRDMQENPQYESLMGEIMFYLREGIDRAESVGVSPEAILVDPGMGFGKTFEHNLTLLRRLKELKALGKPILIGPSRKSFTGKLLNLPVEDRLESTAAAAAWGIFQGASMVRVHDVKVMKRVIVMIDAVRTAG